MSDDTAPAIIRQAHTAADTDTAAQGHAPLANDPAAYADALQRAKDDSARRLREDPFYARRLGMRIEQPAPKPRTVAKKPEKRRLPHLRGTGSYGRVPHAAIPHLPGPALRVAVVLDGCADADRVVRGRSVSYLAEQAECCPRTVRNALECLRKNEIIDGKGVLGNGVRTEFRLLTPATALCGFVLYSVARRLSDTLLRVYLVIAAHVKPVKSAFLKIATISRDAGGATQKCGPRTVKKAVHDLVAGGLLAIHPRARKSSEYALLEPPKA